MFFTKIMNQPTNLQAIGLIASSVRGVFRIAPDGRETLLIGKLPLTDTITTIARSLIPSREQYPNEETLAEMVKQQQNRKPWRLIG